jgi:hypothetical protein
MTQQSLRQKEFGAADQSALSPSISLGYDRVSLIAYNVPSRTLVCLFSALHRLEILR